MFVKNKKAKAFDLVNGIESKILVHNGNLMVVENHFDKGTVALEHAHKHEQAGYIAKGKFEFLIEEEKMILETGDSFYVKANSLHSCISIEEGIIVDIFSPQREDFLNKVKQNNKTQ